MTDIFVPVFEKAVKSDLRTVSLFSLIFMIVTKVEYVIWDTTDNETIKIEMFKSPPKMSMQNVGGSWHILVI